MQTTYNIPIFCQAIVIEDSKVWLRLNERESWELPGGLLERDEQPDQVILRELAQELGIDVTVGAPVANYIHKVPARADLAGGVMVTIYYCTFVKRNMELEDASAEFKAFTKDQIDDLPMPVFYKQAIRAALKGKRI